MNSQTILKLNQLNKKFYNTVGTSFDQTRQEPWEGWYQLLPYFQKEDGAQLRLLDVGCGNGRFGEFLHSQLSDVSFHFTGIDNNSLLLTKAKEKLEGISHTLKKIDIIEEKLSSLMEGTFDVITLFGVLHHIPSFSKREHIIKELSKLLTPTGILIVTAWQFDTIANLMSRSGEIVTQLDIDMNQFEEGDYLLDWKKGESAIRYCHLSTLPEISTMYKASNLQIIESFAADGKNHQSNLYVIGQRDAQTL